jgi:uncharacterized protein YvpB
VIRVPIALLAVVAITAAGCSGGSAAAPSPSRPATTAAVAPLTVSGAGLTLTISSAQRSALAALHGAPARRAARRLLAHAVRAQGPRWRRRIVWPARAAAMVAAAARSHSGSVNVPAAVASVSLRLPAIRQVYRNDCEAAALSMLLAGRVGQLRLQAQLPVSRPFLPESGVDGTVWGDPELGFVGNVRGGGYGVYDRPLLALARRYDGGAINLTGSPLRRIVEALQEGRPVVAWIQLGASIPRSWTTPAGRLVQANFAEHAVTLTGWRPGRITYNNPWTGAREVFTIAGFRQVWRTLGDRAIAGSSLIAQA